MVDMDATFEYSQTELVRFSNASGNIRIYPNSTKGNFRVEFGKDSKIKRVTIYSQFGEQVRVYEGLGQESQLIETKNLASGTYTVEVKGKDRVNYIQLIVL